MDYTSARTEFENAISQLRPLLLARARKRVGDDDAEDVVQDAVYAALRDERWQGVRNPRGWMLEILNSVIYWRFKASSKEAKVLGDDLVLATLDGVEERKRHDEVLDRMLREDETACQVAQILDAAHRANLTPKEAHVLFARLRNEDTKKIAMDMGIDTNAVRSYHSLAVRKIRMAVDRE